MHVSLNLKEYNTLKNFADICKHFEASVNNFIRITHLHKRKVSCWITQKDKFIRGQIIMFPTPFDVLREKDPYTKNHTFLTINEALNYLIKEMYPVIENMTPYANTALNRLKIDIYCEDSTIIFTADLNTPKI